jgi:hypothetical protein
MAIRPGQAYKKMWEQSFDASSVAAVTVSNQTLTTNETVTTEDTVIVQPTAAMTTGVAIVGAFVSAANTITIVLVNPTAGAVDAASVTLKIIVL